MKPKRALGLLLAMLLAQGAWSQERRGGVDFLNERMKIPDSQRFTEGEYIESGVGLRFGVDKRLSYYGGQYDEAALRFEEAVKGFRYKAEIWVYLARAYFYMKEPHKAKEALERAGQVMPDLKERLWDPLLESLLGEIRKRALSLQAQVDFYSKSQDDFLNLFRLYKFLEDYQGASGVIHTAEDRAAKMAQLSTMVSGQNQQAYQGESRKWQALADQLRGELKSLGVEVAPRPTSAPQPLPAEAGQDPELLEKTRLLQLKVDYYQSRLEDYQELFDNYLLLNMPERAAGVVQGVEREIRRLRHQAETAVDLVQESQYLEEVSLLEALRDRLKQNLEPAKGE
jgi:tetratricopeptide (TPR) repeat protein